MKVNGAGEGGESSNESASGAVFDGPVSFADIEEITDDRPKRTGIDNAMGVGDEADEANEADASKANKRLADGEGKDDKGGKDDKKKAEKKDDKSAKADKSSEKGDEKPKSIKAKTEKGELDIALDAKIPVTIAGKVEEFTVQDLINDFSGRTDYGRKYQQLDTERKNFTKEQTSFHNERQELNDAVDTLHKLAVTENKPIEAIAMLTDLLGGDSVKIVEDLQSRMFAQFEELAKLTPEERKLKWSNQKADLLQKKLESKTQAEAKATTQQSIAKRVEAVKTQHNIDDARFNDVYNKLKQSGVKDADLTPEVVGEVHAKWAKMDKIDEIAKEFGVEDEAKLKQLYANCLNLDENKLKAVIQSVYGGKTSKKEKSSLQEKIEKNNGGQQDKNSGQSRFKPTEAITFDDLE